MISRTTSPLLWRFKHAELALEVLNEMLVFPSPLNQVVDLLVLFIDLRILLFKLIAQQTILAFELIEKTFVNLRQLADLSGFALVCLRT